MAVRTSLATQYFQRTTSLPTNTNFTCVWRGVMLADRGSGTTQPISFIPCNASFTDLFGIFWDGSSSPGNMRIACAVGGTETSGTNFTSRPAIDTAYAAYLKCSGTGVGQLEGGWRAEGSNTWITATATLSTSLAATTTWGFANIGASFFSDCKYWNIKLWDRVLTADEILIESYYRRVKFPVSIHAHWLLPNTSNIADISGNARNLTMGGTPTTVDGGAGLWTPSRKIILPNAGGITGTLAVTTVNDTILASGTTTILGTFARAAGNDVLAASGTTTVLGSFARTSSNDTLIASGSPVIVGTLSFTNANDTISANGTTTVVGALSLTAPGDILSAAGTTTVTGNLVLTLASDTLAASGTTTILGTLSFTNANDTIVASGNVGSGVSGTFSVTTVNDAMSASGTTTLVGTFSVTATKDTMSASGTSTILGSMAIILADDTLTASGQVGVGSGVATWLTLTNVGR